MAAFLITALVHAPDMLGPVRHLYSALLDPLRSEHEVAEVRHALLAVEGIFLLRGLGFAEVSAGELKSVLLHARNIVLAALDRSARRSENQRFNDVRGDLLSAGAIVKLPKAIQRKRKGPQKI